MSQVACSVGDRFGSSLVDVLERGHKTTYSGHKSMTCKGRVEIMDI